MKALGVVRHGTAPAGLRRCDGDVDHRPQDGSSS